MLKAVAASVAAAAVACLCYRCCCSSHCFVLITAVLLLLLLLLLLQTSMPAWPSLATTVALLVLPAAQTQRGVATPLLAEAAAVQQEPSTVMELAVQVRYDQPGC